MNNYTRFDRKQKFDLTAIKAVNNILREGILEGGFPFHVDNMLYGLFDGYLYEDLLPEIEKLGNKERTEKVKEIINLITE